MRRILLLISIVLIAFGAQAQTELRRGTTGGSDWVTFTEKGCVGGDLCRNKSFRLALADRPVIGVRFTAHDQVGTKAEGVLRVKIDGNTIDGYIDIPRRGQTFTLDVDELTGRSLVFEPVNDDEVEITNVAVLYGRTQTRRTPGTIPRDRVIVGGNGGWKPYPRAAMCIGNDECRRNGKRITIALDDAPVLGVRFYAHDSIGTKADGALSVRIDDQTIDYYIDIQRAGSRHEFDVDNVRGSKLVIETASNDDVEVKDIEVLYARGSRDRGRDDDWDRGRRGGAREVTHDGGCIGGSQCGGRRARIRVPIHGRAVNSIRFYARDDIGNRAGGEIRISIDDQVVENYLDIPREGRTFTIDGQGHEGDYVYFEVTEDDEVEIKDIRIRFED